MKLYQVIRTVTNLRKKVVSKETWIIGFYTEIEMNNYMNGKWSMAEDNESYVAYEIRM